MKRSLSFLLVSALGFSCLLSLPSQGKDDLKEGEKAEELVVRALDKDVFKKIGLYLNFHNQALHPKFPGKKVTHDFSDAFTLHLAKKDLLNLTRTKRWQIEKRVEATPLDQECISIMLQRAALSDLQCGALEGMLPRWTFDYLQENVPAKQLRTHLEAIRKDTIKKVDLEGSIFSGAPEKANPDDIKMFMKRLDDRVNRYADHVLKQLPEPIAD